MQNTVGNKLGNRLILAAVLISPATMQKAEAVAADQGFAFLVDIRSFHTLSVPECAFALCAFRSWGSLFALSTLRSWRTLLTLLRSRGIPRARRLQQE